MIQFKTSLHVLKKKNDSELHNGTTIYFLYQISMLREDKTKKTCDETYKNFIFNVFVVVFVNTGHFKLTRTFK